MAIPLAGADDLQGDMASLEQSYQLLPSVLNSRHWLHRPRAQQRIVHLVSQPVHRFRLPRGRNTATNDYRRTASIETNDRQADGHCLTDCPATLLVETWEDEHIGVLAHRSQDAESDGSPVKSQPVVSQRVILAPCLDQLAISSAGTSSCGTASINAIDSGLK
jgi:hypothetical protein